MIQVGSGAAIHRALPESNPLSYFERLTVFRVLLRAMNIGSERYCVIPFPIEEPSEVQDFLPSTVTVFTTTYDAWNEQKIRVLQDLGYPVVNLWSRQHKAVAGQDVRQYLREDNPAWRALVPDAVAGILLELNIAERLRTLAPPGKS